MIPLQRSQSKSLFMFVSLGLFAFFVFFNASLLVVAPLCCLNQGPSILFPPQNFHASKLGGSAQSKRHQLKAKMPLLRICSKKLSAGNGTQFFCICNLAREFRSHVLVGVTNSSPLKLGRAPKFQASIFRGYYISFREGRFRLHIQNRHAWKEVPFTNQHVGYQKLQET